MSVPLSLRLLAGKRVRLRGDHPHAGEYGTAWKIERMQGAGEALIVGLEACPHGVGSCAVFEVRHIAAAPEAERSAQK